MTYWLQQVEKGLKQMKALVTASILTGLVALPATAQITSTVTQSTVTSYKDGANEDLPLATEIISDDKLETKMKKGNQYGSMTLTLLSPIDTLIYLNWEDKNNLGIRGQQGVLYRLKANEPRNFTFTSYSAHEGRIQILNKQDEVLKQVPYRVKKYSSARNSTSLNLTLNRMSVSYRRSQGNLSFNASVSTDFEKITPRIGVSYRW